MSDTGVIAASSIAAVTAIAILRLSWGRPRRSVALNSAGWALLVAAFIGGCVSAGAWGASVVSLWAIGAAMAVLGWAAWRSPPARRKALTRRAGILPENGEPVGVGRRIATFLIVTFAAMIAAISLAVAVRWAAVIFGAAEANANVLALFTAPIGWTILAFLVLMTDSRKRQLGIIAVTCAAAIPAILTGSAL